MKKTQNIISLGIILGITSILIRYVLGFFPHIIEQYYSRGLFIPIRLILDTIHQILPFSALYLLIVLLTFLLYKKIQNWRKNTEPISKKISQTILGLCSSIGWIIFLFLSLWGFNYGRIPIQDHLGFQPTPLSLEQIKNRLDELTPIVLEHRLKIENYPNTASFDTSFFPKEMPTIIQDDLEHILDNIGYSNTGFPTIRLGYPKGYLWGFGAAGFYNPFTGECNVDPALHPIDIPFVMAHEYAHAYGFGDEGTCNFLAYLACTASADAFIQYSGIYNYWQYLYAELRKADPEYFTIFFKNLPLPIQIDQTDIIKNGQQYPYFLPNNLHKITYDAYLKTQGVKEGFASYHQVIMLVEGWNKR